jgi:hypothetical protein
MARNRWTIGAVDQGDDEDDQQHDDADDFEDRLRLVVND